MTQTVGDREPASDPQERAWRPAAHAAARLELVGDEDPGTMQHFTTALLLGDLITRLHAAFLVSLLAKFEESTAQRHAYTLARSSGAGDWLSAMSDSMAALQMVGLAEPLEAVVKWPAVRPDSTLDEYGFARTQDLADLAARLRLEKPKRMKRIPVPRAVMDLLLQVRNKTVHGAYESSFYEDHVDVVETAVRLGGCWGTPRSGTCSSCRSPSPRRGACCTARARRSQSHSRRNSTATSCSSGSGKRSGQ